MKFFAYFAISVNAASALINLVIFLKLHSFVNGVDVFVNSVLTVGLFCQYRMMVQSEKDYETFLQRLKRI
jgi:hypothetical protein